MMNYGLFLILCTSILVLTGCLGNKKTVTIETPESLTGESQKSTIVMTGDMQSGAISDEEVDAILGEIFEAIEGGLVTPEATETTQSGLKSNNLMP